MTIRKATTIDIPRIMEIFDNARRYMRATDNRTQWDNGYPSENIVRNDICRGWSHVVETGGNIISTFCLMSDQEPSYAAIDGPGWLDNSPYLTIHRLASDESHSGILHLVTGYALSLSGNIRIDTHADNRPMLSALQHEKYTYCGIIRLPDNSKRLAFQLKFT